MKGKAGTKKARKENSWLVQANPTIDKPGETSPNASTCLQRSNGSLLSQETEIKDGGKTGW